MVKKKLLASIKPVNTIYVRKAMVSGQGLSRGRLHFGNRHIPCVLGRSGIVTGKKEGDGATPRGEYEILGCFYRQDRIGRPVTRLAMSRIQKDDGWCDQPDHGQYNRQVKLPFAGRHERLWRDDRLYDTVLILDYNFRYRIKGRGSAIFFHISSADGQATEGCIAIAPDDMRKLLPMLRPGIRMIIG